MMKQVNVLLLIFLLFSCSTSKAPTSSKDWKNESEQLGNKYAKALGPFYPEYISDIGYSEFESLTTPFSKNLENERLELALKWKRNIEKLLEKETHPELITDMRILLDKLNLEIEGIDLGRKKGIVPFLAVSEFVYENIKELLKQENSRTKINNGLMRFRTYVRGSSEALPLVDGFKAYFSQRLNEISQNKMQGFWPTRNEVEIYLKESTDYLDAIEDLLKTTANQDWKQDFAELKTQDQGYREFLRKSVLPNARRNTTTPYDIFAFSLKDRGIVTDPNLMISSAKIDYIKLYRKFKELGQEVARINHLKKSDPLSVVTFLRSKKIDDPQELLQIYNKTTDDLYELTKSKHLLTVKAKPYFIIRFANKAEAQSMPAPHFISAPILGNENTPSQFVITPPDGERDDFSYLEAIINLTAHEGVPGHGLQHSVARERGTTLIRSWFAFNSVNVEGWALYAEDLVYPYLSKEAQFITVQRRLWRVARMFLDPELNLGLIKPQRVLDVFMKELGFSHPFAMSELKRYSYIIPGQAPSYYYGYKALMEMKTKVLKKPGVNEKCFNDAVLNLGILPLPDVNERLNDLKCP